MGSKSSMKDLLPLMMMSGGMGGAGGAGGMDPMMMMLMLGDDSSSSSSSSMKDLLPLMMMSGGMGGTAGAQGGMNPLLMMSLMEDSCDVKLAAITALTATDDEKKALARGDKCYDATNKKVVACAGTITLDGQYIDYNFIMRNRRLRHVRSSPTYDDGRYGR